MRRAAFQEGPFPDLDNTFNYGVGKGGHTYSRPVDRPTREGAINNNRHKDEARYVQKGGVKS